MVANIKTIESRTQQNVDGDENFHNTSEKWENFTVSS